MGRCGRMNYTFDGQKIRTLEVKAGGHFEYVVGLSVVYSVCVMFCRVLSLGMTLYSRENQALNPKLDCAST